MIPLGLSAGDQELFEVGLLTDHDLDIRVQILDLNHNVISDSHGRVLGGQVDWDQTAAVERSARVQILDEDNTLGLDTGNPYQAMINATRQIRILYGVRSFFLDRWVEVPIFTGPITGVERDGDTVTVTALGKEHLASDPSSLNRQWPKGTLKSTIIRDLLRDTGEQWLDIPAWPGKTTAIAQRTVGMIPWQAAQQNARSFGDVRLVYDGHGVARLRRRDAGSQWLFRGGTLGSLISEPKITTDDSAIRNLILVKGGIPKGAKVPVTAQANAPYSHPLSAVSLGRGGKPRYIREDITDDKITSKAAAQKLADSLLQTRLEVAVNISAMVMPIPHLEPGDVVTIAHDTWQQRIYVQRATIPLTPDQPMSIGRTYATRRTVKPPRRGRR